MIFLGIINIFGILLEISGVLVVFRSDLLNRQIEAMYDRIPGNPLLESYQAVRDGKERVVSEEEEMHQKLEETKSSGKDLNRFKTALALVGFGMFFQLIAAICALISAI